MDHEHSSSQETSFEAPRHWVGVEELNPEYWNDPKIREKRGQEFYEKPIEAIALIDKLDQKGIARRDFLTIMGASMAMTTVACARRPVHKIIPYVIKPEEIIPGVPNYYATTFPETGEGILGKNREGRPIKLEGNPDHPLNRGALSLRGQASLLSLYDPDRLSDPMTGGRAGGSSRKIAWKDVDSAIEAKLKTASNVRILSRPVTGQSSYRLVSEFLSAFRNGALVEYDPVAFDELLEGQQLCYGTSVVPRYRFDEASVVVSLSGDFLGAWPNATEHARDWAKTRKLEGTNSSNAKMSKLVCFEPRMSITGASSDERYPIRPGDEHKVALALAHEIIVARKQTRFANDAAVTSIVAGYTPEHVAEEIGIEGGAGKLKEIAHLLLEARGKGIVLAGGVEAKTRDALALQVAVNLLNSALENDGSTIDGSASALQRRPAGYAGMAKLIQEMNAGQVEVLILHRSNPMYHLPRWVGFEAAVKKVPLVINIDEYETETSAVADYSLPLHHYLENWGDYQPVKGLYSLQQPLIAPLHDSRALEDALIVWARGSQLRAGGVLAKIAAAPADKGTWHDYLQANWQETVYREAAPVAGFELFWEGSLREGVVKTSYSKTHGAARSFRNAAMSQVPKYASQDVGGPYLALYVNNVIHDGTHANNAWLQEMPDPIAKITWDNFVNVSPALAAVLGLVNNDVVELSVGDVKAELPVYIQPGMHHQTVSVALGYGRRSVGKVGNYAGVDVYPFLTVENGRLVYSGNRVSIRKTGKFYNLASTQWHNVTENRPIIGDTTLAAYRKNPAAAEETAPELRLKEVLTMWPEHEYRGYRWGMAVDLNSCIGCGACAIACQAENNIPVVGRDQVRNSRQMHWIRIDRYYSGSPERPHVAFQPMLCQQCENAPCETVCPVLATVHNDEGLNEQVYNRCVGTRYCQNNCPYKVRRFNFFDHWKSYTGPMNLVWNPEVTVRSRGIMEKCTFCVQRIRDARDAAKDKGEKIAERNLKTACQQTCPTDAITFGDINDPKTRVSELAKDPRGYRVLENLNTRPSITYLTKVRNVSES